VVVVLSVLIESVAGMSELWNKDWLEQKRSEGFTNAEIADMVGCSRQTVGRWVRKHDLPKRNAGGSGLPKETRDKLADGVWLQEQYVSKKQTVTQSADSLGCSNATVLNRMDKFGIERRQGDGGSPPGEAHHQWKGGHERYYGPNWPKQRKEALERDDYLCQICGLADKEHRDTFGNGLNVHHIIPITLFKNGGDVNYEKANSLNNLIALCTVCHNVWEGIPLRPQTTE